VQQGGIEKALPKDEGSPECPPRGVVSEEYRTGEGICSVTAKNKPLQEEAA